MLTIRLQRKGKKNQPFFKIVVTEEKKSSTRGRFVEELGFYNPLTKERKLKGDRAKYWISVGAQPSDTVYNMLITDNIIEGKKRPKHKKSKKKQSETETAAPAAAAPAENTAPAPESAQVEATEKPKEADASKDQPQKTPLKEQTKAQEDPQPKDDKPVSEAQEEPKKDTQEGVDKS